MRHFRLVADLLQALLQLFVFRLSDHITELFQLSVYSDEGVGYHCLLIHDTFLL